MIPDIPPPQIPKHLKKRKALIHWSEVNEQYHTIENFITWLFENYNLDFDWESSNAGTPLDTSKLLDEFLKVDRKKLEKQRRELLEELT